MEESFTSNAGLIALALRDLIKSLQPDNLVDEEVQIRGSWLNSDGHPHVGISIVPLGEQPDPGTIGTQDIGYEMSVVFVEKDSYDARMSDDQMFAWRELIRRRLTDQRLQVTIVNQTDPSEHVCRVIRCGESLRNPNKYPTYNINRMVVVVWLRELNP
jgi:hypothetical protein